MRSYDVPSLRARFAGAWPHGIVPDHVPEGHRYRREDTGELAWSVTTKLQFVAKPYLQTWYAKRGIEHIRENLERLRAGDTSVLEEALGAAVRSRDASAEIGTTAHDAFDRYLSRWISTGVRDAGRSAVDDLNELCAANGVEPKGEEIAACRSFDRFLAENEIIPLASEIRIWYSRGKDVFAGTVDAIFLSLTVYKDRVGDAGVQTLDGRTCAEAGHDYEAQPSGNWWCVACGREVTVKLVLGDHKTSNDIKTKDDYAHQSVAYGKSIEIEVAVKFDEIWVMRYGKGKAEYEVCKVDDRKAAWKEWLTVSRAFDEKMLRGDRRLLAPLVEKKVTSLL